MCVGMGVSGVWGVWGERRVERVDCKSTSPVRSKAPESKAASVVLPTPSLMHAACALSATLLAMTAAIAVTQLSGPSPGMIF